MSKTKEVLKKIESFLLELGIKNDPVVKLAEYVSGDKTIVVDEDGNATIDGETAPDGEYPLEDGRTVVVSDGKATIKEAEADVELEEEEEPSEVVKEKTIEDLIDLSQDGYYTIEISVENGKIVFGNVYSSTITELSDKEIKKVSKEVDKLKKAYDVKLAEVKKAMEAKLNDLSKSVKKVIQAPTDTEPVKLSAKEIIKNRVLNK